MVVTLKDIAKKANVSTATVSKVLNKKTSDIGADTIKLVEKLIEDEGYVPNAIARAMRTKRSHIIGLLIPDIRNPFFTELARGAEDLAYQLGYSLFLCNTDDNLDKETKYLISLQQLRIDGMIIAGSAHRNPEREATFVSNVPMIAIDRQVYYKNISATISTDNFSTTKRLAQELYNKGYRSFLYLGGPEDSSVSRERYEGTLAGLENKNIKKFEVIFGDFLIEDGYKRVFKKKNIRDYDVLVCGNDLIAIGALSALKDLDIVVPDQISVMGFDDIELASSFIPRLSTVKQPTYQMGADAIILIDEILKGKKSKPTYKHKQRIIFRETTK